MNREIGSPGNSRSPKFVDLFPMNAVFLRLIPEA